MSEQNTRKTYSGDVSEKIFNTRIIHKHDTEANWEKATNFIPKQGELIVYDADENCSYARTKMGDGVTAINGLSFMSDIFWATPGVTSPYEIYEAHKAGKLCYFLKENKLSSGDPYYEVYKMEHIAIQQGMPCAYFSYRTGIYFYWAICSPTVNPNRGLWNYSYFAVLTKDNLTKTIDEASTDTTVPTSKAVRDYFKWENLPDKPFYYIDEEVVVLDMDLKTHTNAASFNLEDGVTYTITFNGKEYVETAMLRDYDRGPDIILGEPSYWYRVSGGDVVPFGVSLLFQEIQTRNTGHIKITYHRNEIKYIDEKVIPDTIARVADIPTGALADKDKVGKTDLEQSIQESLNKADSALQSAPVTSVNGSTGAVTIKAVPACSTTNNGQFLRVVNGAAAWSTVPNAEEASF